MLVIGHTYQFTMAYQPFYQGTNFYCAVVVNIGIFAKNSYVFLILCSSKDMTPAKQESCAECEGEVTGVAEWRFLKKLSRVCGR